MKRSFGPRSSGLGVATAIGLALAGAGLGGALAGTESSVAGPTTPPTTAPPQAWPPDPLGPDARRELTLRGSSAEVVAVPAIGWCLEYVALNGSGTSVCADGAPGPQAPRLAVKPRGRVVARTGAGAQSVALELLGPRLSRGRRVGVRPLDDVGYRWRAQLPRRLGTAVYLSVAVRYRAGGQAAFAARIVRG